jgi:hypothetical protein
VFPKDKILYFNFEDERVELSTPTLDLVLQSYRELYPEINLREAYFSLMKFRILKAGKGLSEESMILLPIISS